MLAFIVSACAVKQKSTQTEAVEMLPFSKLTVTGKLDNGMNYYIIQNKMPVDKIELRLNVRSASLNETEEERGLAHFVEHMAFNGTKNFSGNELVRFLEEAGLSFGHHSNAYTSFGNTNYMLSVPAADKSLLEQSFVILRDWADGVTFDEDEIEKEKGVITEEWRTRNESWYRLSLKARNEMYAGSRYTEREPIGLMEVVAGANKKLLKGYYDRWYTAGNMSVVVAGNIEVEEAKALIEKHFNTVEKRTSPNQADDTRHCVSAL